MIYNQETLDKEYKLLQQAKQLHKTD